MGVVIDGMPSNIEVNISDLQAELDRRAPGRVKGTTARKERTRLKLSQESLKIKQWVLLLLFLLKITINDLKIMTK